MPAINLAGILMSDFLQSTLTTPNTIIHTEVAHVSTHLRVFIIECPNPIDLLQGRNEGKSLEQICKMVGHEVSCFRPKSKNELAEVCRYIASIDREYDGSDDPDLPICIHISSHGEEDGLFFGRDLVGWKELLEVLEPVCTKKSTYRGEIILILSACEAKGQQLTRRIQKISKENKALRPPKHFFITADEEVYWNDAVVAWALFYNKIPKTKFSKKKKIIEVLTLIENAKLGAIHYFRWLEKKKKYQSYSANGKIDA